MTRARDLGDFIADGAAAELVVDTTTLVVDSTNNRVGIGTASPSQALEVTGTAKLATVDINAGAIDGAVIGANSAAAVTATTLNASTKLQVNSTDVITNARQLSNIASIDATTAAAITAGGVGGGGAADFVASGAIANGDIVILNANGTVSKVTSTSVSTATGSSTQFVTSNVVSSGLKSCFDSTNNKVVIAYTTNAGSGNKGYVIIGTVSGTSISFGTQVAFSPGEVDVGEVVYDSSNNRVVIIYTDTANNNYGTAIVGTVSGTSISFGSPVIWVFTSATYSVACFDSANNKVVAFYRRGSSGIGTAIVGTVSGTSISFGTEQTIGNASVFSNPSSAVFDSNVNKVAVVYRNDSKGKVSVGTVSGTSISFGSEVILESSSQVDSSSMSFDPVANTIVLAYEFSNRCLVRTATISGTSISFGTKTDLDTGSNGSPITTAYHTDANKTVIFYRDEGNGHYLDSHTATVSGTTVTVSTSVNIDPNSCFRGNLVYDSNAKKVVMAYKPESGSFSDDGAAIVYTPGYTNNSPTVTSSNYIGLAAEAISNSATGSITINGGINEGQSSLAIGTVYYVADNGTLQTTNNGRKIGKAIATTKILVNSNMSGDEMNAYLGGLV